jgi:hypothetical protein
MRALFKEHATRTKSRGLISQLYPARRKISRRNTDLFALDAFETTQLESLRTRGYAFAPGVFSKELVDNIHKKADAMFGNTGNASTSAKEMARRGGSLPNRLTSPERMRELEDPLVHISEVLDIAFHESILKLAVHFFQQIPPVYRVDIVRYFPCNGAEDLSGFCQENDSDSLQILVDLAAVDDTGGPLVYVPGSHLYGFWRPRLLNALGLPVEPRQLRDEEVECLYPRNTWATLSGESGSVTTIHRRGLNKGPAWAHPGDINNKPRTSIRIDITGQKPGTRYPPWPGNRMRRWNFDRMSAFQQVFTHAVFVEEKMLA